MGAADGVAEGMDGGSWRWMTRGLDTESPGLLQMSQVQYCLRTGVYSTHWMHCTHCLCNEYAHVCTHVHISVHMHLHMSRHMSRHMSIHILRSTCPYAYTHVHTMYVHICVHMSIPMSMHVYTQKYKNAYTHVHTRAYYSVHMSRHMSIHMCLALDSASWGRSISIIVLLLFFYRLLCCSFFLSIVVSLLFFIDHCTHGFHGVRSIR